MKFLYHAAFGGAALALSVGVGSAQAQIGQAGPNLGKAGQGRVIRECTLAQKALKHETCRNGGLIICTYSNTPSGCTRLCSGIPRHPKCGKR